ncbi:MAG: hypothetical protein LBU86_05845 [Oscillospiraceae bacterium]|jgi:hypothetical protein|nr:hypothetical protein [Oscillospiraceae bacterium]
MEFEALEILDNAIARRQALTLQRPELPEPELLCIPIKRSEELLLVHVFYEFRPDGYRIVRLEDIGEILRDEVEEFFERIIAAEGVYTSLKAPPETDLSSWSRALSSIKGRYECCILECEDEEDDFLVGRLMELSDWDFTFWYFDATGRWDDELYTIDYDDLTAASFDDNYTNTIIKYIPKPYSF